MPQPTRALALSEQDGARFWAHVDKNGPLPDPVKYPLLKTRCWLSTYNLSHGYALMRIAGVQVGAHRVSWVLLHGSIPDGALVLHACDNRRCVRHLFLGSYQDNKTDSVEKGRHARGEQLAWAKRGEANPRHKLYLNDVKNIRELYKSGVGAGRLASIYGVNYSTVYRITHQQRWAHCSQT